MSHTILDQLSDYADWLIQEERSAATAEKYLRSLRRFALWLNERPLCKANVLAWRAHLQEKGYAPGTINTMLAALHSYFRFADITDCSVKYLRVQRSLFRDSDRALSLDDYHRLVRAAYSIGQHQLALIIETICATGIRVSEVKYITVEALACGKVEISLKGKIRTILIPGKLCKKLKKYAKKKRTVSGEIFITKTGTGLSRKQIWAEMKAICQRAKVAASKVFPHNLRHLFARTFYKVCRDVAKLADVLGHSSIETTRIYLISTGKEHNTILDKLRLTT